MKNNYFLKMKIAAAFVFCFGLQNGAKAQTINVSEDAYVWGASGKTTTNYGSDVEGQARDTATSSPRITYLKFSLASVTATSITTAKIKFFTYLPSGTVAGAASEILQFFKVPNTKGGVANTWNEATVTFDTRPLVAPTSIGDVTVLSVPTTSPNDYSNSYEVDVTAYFNAALAANDTDISFAIKALPKDIGGQQKQVRIGTKEAGTGGQYGSSITYVAAPLGLNDFESNQSVLKVYPNPTDSAFTLSRTFNSSDIAEVAVFNILGSKVAGFKEAVVSGAWSKELNAKELNMSKGVYLIKISSQSNGSSVNKVIVQ